ncbi:class I SAM-dependent methyltransferase [Patescibacteria group bacterium]|nr:class I SAM-dependent methyltransferase [Patescibacteria group bacterium]
MKFIAITGMIIISFSMIDPLRQPLITLFLEYNSRINLSAIRDSEGVYSKHILDSLEVTKIVDF